MWKKNDKKTKIIYSSIIISVSIFIIIGIFYGNDLLNILGNNNHKYGVENESECLKTSLGEEYYKELEIIGANKMTDAEAMSLIPMNFNVNNTCSYNISYDIVVEVNRLTNVDINNSKIDLNGQIINFSSLQSIDSNRGLNRYTLKSNQIINSNQTNDFSFKIWESESSLNTVNNEGNIISVKVMLIEN